MSLPKLVDDLVTKRIAEAVRAGASRTAAAEAARIGRSTLHSWLKRGATGQEPYAHFLEKVREAEGELERELLTTIKLHAVDTWQAAAWIAERRWPKRWALRRPAPESAEKPPSTDLSQLTAEQLADRSRQVMARIAARDAAKGEPDAR